MINYTIIIPHKNTPKYLQRCLDSIPEREDIQVIVVDDNSDNVDTISFPGLNKKNTEVYFTKEGKGAGYARNIGLSYAMGKWLLFADADDYFNKGFLEIIDKYQNSDNDVIYFSASSIDNKTGKIANRNKDIVKAINNFNKEKYKTVEDLIFKNWTPWSKMFKHNFIKQKNLFFEEVKVGNDALFVMNAGIKAKNIEVINYPIYCVTYDKKSLTYNSENDEILEERFLAKVRINNFLIVNNKEKFKLPLGDDIINIYRCSGLTKAINKIKLAKNNGNDIFLPIIKATLKILLIKVGLWSVK
jgi:glycosyltransferase involved in cell wall biosynthesis